MKTAIAAWIAVILVAVAAATLWVDLLQVCRLAVEVAVWLRQGK